MSTRKKRTGRRLRYQPPKTLEEAIQRVAQDIVTTAQNYITEYRDSLDEERGGIPMALAGVMGAVNQGVGGWFWALSPETSKRLQIPKTNEQGELLSRLHLWAGLRVLNEAAIVIEKTWPDLLDGLDGHDYWLVVLLYRSFGKSRFIELVRAADGYPDEIVDLLKTGDVPALKDLSSAVVARRILTAATRVFAAEVVHGGPLPTSRGDLISAPDARWRKKWAKGIAATGLLTHVANLALSSGWITLPRSLQTM